jgi:hypothetical protein
MRLVVYVLACAAIGAMSVALADPPATPAAAATTTSQAPATNPATPSQSASSTSAPSEAAKGAKTSSDVVVESTAELDSLEKHFIAEGYKMEMHHGEKLFCRREEETGSHLGGQKVCNSAVQLQANERDARRALDKSSMQQNNPSGK